MSSANIVNAPSFPIIFPELIFVVVVFPFAYKLIESIPEVVTFAAPVAPFSIVNVPWLYIPVTLVPVKSISPLFIPLEGTFLGATFPCITIPNVSLSPPVVGPVIFPVALFTISAPSCANSPIAL